MRSLVITPTPTHPTNQGNRARVHQIASALRRHGRVELLYSAVDGLDANAAEAMRAAWDVVHIVPPGVFRPWRRVPSHWGLDEWVGPNLIEAVRFLAATQRYDVVVANYVWCSLLLTPFTDAIRVLDTHDRFGARHELARAAGLSPHWFYTTTDNEARGLDRADIVLAIQAGEARYFRAITRKPIEVLEYAPPPVTVARRSRNRTVVGYFGSGNPWNVASLTVFDRRLAAVFNERGQPDAAFLMIGGVTRLVSSLAVFRSGGTVNDVTDAYAALDIVVNPMTGGTGLKIKTVEALAHGRAVLSTRDGGTGLEAVHPDLLHADVDSLIVRLLGLLDEPGRIPELAREQGAGYVAFHARVAAKVDAFCEGFAAGRYPHPGPLPKPGEGAEPPSPDFGKGPG